MIENPLVSICIPTYRGATYLEATINSVLDQSYPHFEIWIVDDNSPDETPAVVSRYVDPRIHYVRNPDNLGPAGNWNKCFELATGKYFKLLPHDDLLSPECLAEQVSILELDRESEIALVFGSRGIADPNGRIFMTRGLPQTYASRIKGLELVKRCVRAGTNLIGEPGNGLFRRDISHKVGAYDSAHPYMIDLDYFCRVLQHGDAYYTATRTSLFRVTPGSWSVAIGSRQYQDFKGFINKLRADTKFNISASDSAIGLVRARINTMARAIIYYFMFRGGRGAHDPK